MLLLAEVPALVHAQAVIRPRGTGVKAAQQYLGSAPCFVAMTTTVNPSVISGRHEPFPGVGDRRQNPKSSEGKASGARLYSASASRRAVVSLTYAARSFFPSSSGNTMFSVALSHYGHEVPLENRLGT